MPDVGEGGSQVPQERWGPGLIRDRNLHLHISRPPHSSEFQKHFSKPEEKNKEEQANLSQMVIVQIVFSFPGIESKYFLQETKDALPGIPSAHLM